MSNYFEKIMIVDDDKIDRWMLRKQLEKIELAEEIIEVETGVEALNLLTASTQSKQRLPELLFLDLNMPLLTGLEFLDVFSKMKSQYKTLCRIVITCSTYDAAEKKRALEYENVIGYFLKPLDETVLMQVKKQLGHTKAS